MNATAVRQHIAARIDAAAADSARFTRRSRDSAILVANPMPAIPTLHVAWLA